MDAKCVKEASIIENTNLPRTRQSITTDLAKLGLEKGMTVRQGNC